MDQSKQMFSLKLITEVMIISLFVFPIVTHFEGKKVDAFTIYAIAMLGMALSILNPIIQSLNNRVKELEERLKQSQE